MSQDLIEVETGPKLYADELYESAFRVTRPSVLLAWRSMSAVETSAGKLVGSRAMYFRQPHEPTPRDRQLAAALIQSGAIIISHYQEAQAHSGT